MTKATELMERITRDMISDLEQADQPGWQPAWVRGRSVWKPLNPTTDRHYTAGNALILGLTATFEDKPPIWATYRQWQELGDEEHPVHVRKGAKASADLLRPVFRKVIEDDGTKREKLVSWSLFKVFNAIDVEGYEIPPIGEPPTVTLTEAHDEIVEMYERVGCTLVWSDEVPTPQLQPTMDRVVMPSLERWSDVDRLWSIAYHELIHWTGMPDNLARPSIVRMIEDGNASRDDAYAFEELTAELGAAFGLARIGRISTFDDNHRAYIGAWLRIMGADSNVLWKAASRAEAAVNFIERKLALNMVAS